jgi:hypothetical protein
VGGVVLPIPLASLKRTTIRRAADVIVVNIPGGNMTHVESIHDVVVAILGQMGLYPTPASLLRTILIRDGYYVGQKYRFDGGYAMWVAATNVIEIYDADNNLLNTVAMEKPEEEEAAA